MKKLIPAALILCALYSATAFAFDTPSDAADEMEESKAEVKTLSKHENAKALFEWHYILSDFPNVNYSNTKGINNISASTGMGFSLLFTPLQGKLGRIDIGPKFGFYTIKSSKLNAATKLNFQTYGLQMNYEMQYWIGQMLIPEAVVGYDMATMNNYPAFGQSISANFNSLFYGGSISLNLNSLEQRVASTSLVSTGIKKFYLTYSYLRRTNANPNYAGSANVLGLRFLF